MKKSELQFQDLSAFHSLVLDQDLAEALGSGREKKINDLISFKKI